jgi:hypothetical protein
MAIGAQEQVRAAPFTTRHKLDCVTDLNSSAAWSCDSGVLSKTPKIRTKREASPVLFLIQDISSHPEQ